jgi:glutaredoxin
MKPTVAAGRRGAEVRSQAGAGSSPATAGRSIATTKMYQPGKVRLFIKPFCGWCSQAMDWLDDHHIEYEVLDVTEDRKAYEEMYRLSGQTAAPVVDVDGRVLADFGARELAVFWQKLDRGGTNP